jgi:hypothetical protein
VKFGWKVNEMLVSIGELLSRDSKIGDIRLNRLKY